MKDLAVIIPTRGRPHNIRKVIEAWDFTGAWVTADMILAVDQDDPSVDGYVAFDGQRNGLRVDFHPTWTPMVHKLNRVAVAVANDYFALGFAGDDHVPRTIGWAETYLGSLREIGTGMVFSDDGYQGGKLSTEWAVTSNAVRALGRMIPADVEHMYCDNSILDLFSAANAVRHLAHIRIEHMHPVAKKAEMDAQYRRVNSNDQFAKDKRAYEEWRTRGITGDVTAIKMLNPQVQPARRRRPARLSRRSTPTRKRGNTMTLKVQGTPREFRNVTGATPDEIGLTLADMAMGVSADQAIVEIGVYQGRTALLMAWGARQGNGAHVWGFDAWELAENTYAAPFKTVESRNWATWNVNSTGYQDAVTLTQGFSADCAEQWEGPKIGLLFIDADHSADGTRADVVNWSRHMAPNGIVALDDYGHPDWPGVRQATDQLVSEGFLAPVEIFHDRLAVTRLLPREEADNWSVVEPKALTAMSIAELQTMCRSRGLVMPAGRPSADRLIRLLSA